METYSQWCNLPSDILVIIAKNVDHLHVRQLRGVCTSWRSSLPLPRSIPLLLEVPCAFTIAPAAWIEDNPSSLSQGFAFYLVERTVYLISPPPKSQPQQEESSTPSSTIPASIIKVEQSGNKWTLFNPLTGVRFNQADQHDVCMNLLDYRFSQITKAYTLWWVIRQGCYSTGSCTPDELVEYFVIKKLVTFQNFFTIDDGREQDMSAVLALLLYGNLAVWKPGCDHWTTLPRERFSDIVDAICYEGKFYVVDCYGNLTVIDPLTFEPIKYVVRPDHDYGVPAFVTCLLEFEEHLYMLNIVFLPDGACDDTKFQDVPIFMLRFVLNEEAGCWVTVDGDTSLGNAVLFWGMNSTFAILAKCLGWPRGNYIYCARSSSCDVGLLKRMSLLKDMDMNTSMDKRSSRRRKRIGFGKGSGEYGCVYDYNSLDNSLKRICDCDHPFVSTKIFCPPSTLVVSKAK